MTDRVLLTTRELADQLGVAPVTILRWQRRGQLPGVRLPSGALRFAEDAIAQWLAARTTPARGVVPTTPDTGAAERRLTSVGPTTPEDEE